MTDPATGPDFWGIALPWVQGVIFFILGVVGTVLVENRRSVRADYELWVWKTTTSLSKPEIGASRDHLQYVVNGTTVKEPYEVDIDLWSNGKRDIHADLFNGRATYIDLGVPIVGQLKHQSTAADETSLEVVELEGKILIHPSVVRRGMAARWVFMTDGEPKMKLMNAPLDTDFTSWADTYRGPRPTKTAAKIVGWSLIALAIATFVISIVFTRNGVWSMETGLVFSSLVAVALLMGGFMTLLFGTNAYGSRLRLARKALFSRKLRSPVESAEGDGEGEPTGRTPKSTDQNSREQK